MKDVVAFGHFYGVDQEGFMINSHAIFQANFIGAMVFKE
jgi:hypothetical protein